MPGREWTDEQKAERSQQLKDYWQSPEGQARLKGMKEAGYEGTGFKEYWDKHKDKDLPDQRVAGTEYMNLYMKKYRQRKPGYLTFRRQVRLGLIPPDSDYEAWLEEYQPRKQHPWLKSR